MYHLEWFDVDSTTINNDSDRCITWNGLMLIPLQLIIIMALDASPGMV